MQMMARTRQQENRMPGSRREGKNGMGARREPNASECKFASMTVCVCRYSHYLTHVHSFEKGEAREKRTRSSDSWSGLRDNRIRQMQERFHMRFFTVAPNYDKCSQF